MIALLQRVSEARVDVEGRCVGQIGPGLLTFVCAQRDDDAASAEALLVKLLNFRVFAEDPAVDARGRMNRSLLDVAGGLLVVPQFTLAANTRSGTRPSFTPAAAPALGRELFDYFVAQAMRQIPDVQTGVFGADMKVHLVNDGPVTFWLEV